MRFIQWNKELRWAFPGVETYDGERGWSLIYVPIRWEVNDQICLRVDWLDKATTAIKRADVFIIMLGPKRPVDPFRENRNEKDQPLIGVMDLIPEANIFKKVFLFSASV